MQRALASNPRLSDVLRETAAALWTEGYDRLSVETLARRAGVSRSTVYRHWADKRSLVIAAIVDVFDRHVPLVEPGPGVDPIDALRHLAETFGKFGADPDASRVATDILRRTVRDEEFGRLWSEQVVAPRRASIVRLLRAGIQSGNIRKDFDVEVAADALLGGLGFRLLLDSRRLDGRFGEVLVGTVVAGFDHAAEHFSDVFADPAPAEISVPA